MGLILKGWMMSYGVSNALPLSYGSDPEGMDDVIRGKQCYSTSYGSDPEGMDDVIRGKQRSSTQLWV